jgi:hypothetical protein
VWVVGTAADLAPFAHDMGCMLRPFRWDDGRRAVLRSEVDAMIFHIYGIERDDSTWTTSWARFKLSAEEMKRLMVSTEQSG